MVTLFSAFFDIQFYSLQQIAKGLKNHHPFNDTPAVAIILRNAKSILASVTDKRSVGYVWRIWGLMSNFVLFDCLCITFGVASVAPSQLWLTDIVSQAILGLVLR